MRIIYTVSIHAYGIFLLFASFFNKKAKEWTEGRKKYSGELANLRKDADRYCWIHCASAGEFEQAIPLIEAIRTADNRLKIAVSFFSPSGFELYFNSGIADIVFYFPLDTASNSTSIVEKLRPEFVLFIRNELWWNTLNRLKEHGIPAFLINANTEQKRNPIYRYYLNECYPLFTKIYSTEKYGNTKLERVLSNKTAAFEDAFLSDFCKDSIVLLLGSSWKTEEKLIATFYRKYAAEFSNLKLIIAPHEFDSDTKARLEQLFSEKIIPYQNEKTPGKHRILFLDKKGILKYAYRFADIAIIGGGFEHRVHNIAEAAVYGLPTLFGSNHQGFEEVNQLVSEGCAFSVNTGEEFEKLLVRLITDKTLRVQISMKLNDYFSAQRHTAAVIIREILAIKKSLP
jgi:3-deoxy-D-manno-octulosonic-acid transferase